MPERNHEILTITALFTLVDISALDFQTIENQPVQKPRWGVICWLYGLC